MTIVGFALCAAAQTGRVHGVVISSEDQLPVIGATVMLPGSKTGVSTDANGQFTINNLPAGVKTLDISCVGMAPKTVTITPGTMQIVLDPSAVALDEVVVTALGISRSEKTLGYAATSVDGAQIQQARTTNVMSALQGKVAGLAIQSTSSDPGMANNVVIRGIGSINGSNQPLYVVDGVPVDNGTVSSQGHAVAAGGVSNIAPDDIASLTVLKGAAATALYGSRASNGVIIITTKSGKKVGGKNYTVSYSGSVEASRVSLIPEMQNKWGQGWNGNQTYIENGSWGPALDGSLQVYGPVWNHSQLLHVYDAKRNNVRDFYDTGWSQNHNVSLSGVSADDKMTYYASFSHTDANGVMPTDADSYKRNTISARGSFKPEQWFEISSVFNFANWRTKTVGSFQGTSPIDGVLELPRDVSIVDMADLSNPFNTPEAYFTPYGITNPYWALANNYNVLNGKQTFGKLQAAVFPTEGMSLTYRFGFDYSDYDRKVGTPEIAVTDALINNDYGYSPVNMNQSGSVYSAYRRTYEINNDFLANYTKTFLNNKLDMNVTAGVSLNERYFTFMEGQTDNLAIATDFWMLSNGATKSVLSESTMKRRLVGVFGDVTLGWDNWLYLDLTARNDWSSTLPKNDRSFFYPGATLSGIFTKFIPDNSVLTFGKVRLAYGKTGNDASPYYTATNYVQAVTGSQYAGDIITFPFNGKNAFMASTTSGAKTLRPEMTQEFEVGTNLKLFNGRIDVDASYYDRRSKDQIFTLPVDPATGFSYQVVNFGEVRNHGYELMVNTVPVETRDWTWNIGINFSKNYNKVLSMPESLEGGKVSIYNFSAGNHAVYMYAEEGKALGQYYTYLPQYVTDKNSEFYGRPIVDSKGQPVLGTTIEATGASMNHDWTGGVTTSLRFRDFTLSAAMDVRYGGMMFSRTKDLMQFTGNGLVTSENERRPFIIPGSVVANADGTYSENTTPIYIANSSFQQYFDSYGYGNGGMSYLLDRSFTKIRNISLAWQLPAKWLKPVMLREVVLTAYVNNPFLWTARGNRYIDPESTTTTSAGDLAYGFGELYTNPGNRTFGLNLKVNF